MSSFFGVDRFVFESGEEYCLVVDRSSGLPLYYPNLYLTTQVRNKSSAFGTMEKDAYHLLTVLRFFNSRGIDIESRLLTKRFLRPHELDDLRDYCQLHAAMHSVEIATRVEFSENKIVSNTHLYARLSTIAIYLRWLAMILVDREGYGVIELIDAMYGQIKERRPRNKGRNEAVRDKSLDDDQVDLLFEVVRPGSDFNPFSEPVQRRNRLIILMLEALGIRGGEMLNVRIRDINFGTNQLEIVRRADEVDDTRTRKPKAKTQGRLLPLSDRLARELHQYISQDRRKVRNASKHDYLFISYRAQTIGQPLSYAAYNKVISKIGSVFPQLHTITGHMLRHTWNHKFSEMLDSMDKPLTEEKQEQLRSFLMGWKSGSGTASTYNKRFIEEKANKAALQLQNDIGTRFLMGLNHEDL